jgi:hypothetical protein
MRLLVGCAGVPHVGVGCHIQIQQEDRIRRRTLGSNKYKLPTTSTRSGLHPIFIILLPLNKPTHHVGPSVDQFLNHTLFFQANFDFIRYRRAASDPYIGSKTLDILRYQPPSTAKQSTGPTTKTEDYGLEVNKPHLISLNINKDIEH